MNLFAPSVNPTTCTKYAEEPQIAAAVELPVVHTVKLLDWAYGGPKPKELAGE